MERATVKRDCDHFTDVSLVSPINVARRIAKDGIDVLIDYDGTLYSDHYLRIYPFLSSIHWWLINRCT
jgi:predicted O-linked N-acetylglucosamine transferase (SPINDLY family)